MILSFLLIKADKVLLLNQIALNMFSFLSESAFSISICSHYIYFDRL